jgi:phage shock protein C
MDQRKLTRSSQDQVIAGVCSGLAKYFNTDPVLVRIIFFLLVFMGGSGVFLYLVLWLILPTDAEAKTEHPNPGQHEPVIEHLAPKKDQKQTIGLILILLGMLFLLNNYFPSFEVYKLWPLGLVLIGLLIIHRRSI